MWSRKFYHSFAQLSTEVIRGNWVVIWEYATFWEVEPFWGSSSQTRRPTNWATPGYFLGVLYTMFWENAIKILKIVNRRRYLRGFAKIRGSIQYLKQSNQFGVPAPKPGALPTGPHPDMKLKKKSRSGQICGQGNSTTFLANLQRRYLRMFTA